MKIHESRHGHEIPAFASPFLKNSERDAFILYQVDCITRGPTPQGVGNRREEQFHSQHALLNLYVYLHATPTVRRDWELVRTWWTVSRRSRIQHLPKESNDDAIFVAGYRPLGVPPARSPQNRQQLAQLSRS